MKRGESPANQFFGFNGVLQIYGQSPADDKENRAVVASAIGRNRNTLLKKVQ